MPIHDFSAEPAGVPEIVAPPGERFDPVRPPGLSQLSDVQGGRAQQGARLGTVPTYTQEFLVPGFRSLDAAMKKYWSDIRVPTKDSYRFLRIKLAGGDRTLLVWQDDLVGGRVRLPVASIDRTGWEFNPQKYSPSTTHPMAVRYTSKRGDLAVKVFRPVPFLVNYTISVWTQRKLHAEFVNYQVATRFNPMAEFRMFDGHLQGTVTMASNGFQDTSDKEVGADQAANVRYEFSLTAEAWLPLPEQVVKTVLGRVSSVRERPGAALGGGKWYETI